MSIRNNNKKITNAISKVQTKRACENAIHIKDLIRQSIQVFCKRQLSWLDGCKSTLLALCAESLKHSHGTRLRRLKLESLECRQLLTSDLISLAGFETPIGGNAGSSFESSVSANGRYVAFTSDASNLVAGDTNNARDVFVKDMQTGFVERISTTDSGGQANGSSHEPMITPDGRYVVFSSVATNLQFSFGPSLPINIQRIFVKQIVGGGGVTRVSPLPVGDANSNESRLPSISDDGHFVGYVRSGNIYVRDITYGEVGSETVVSEHFASDPFISPNGRFVAFRNALNNLVTGDTNGVSDIFVRDTLTGSVMRASTDSAGLQANATSFAPKLSSNGRFVVFESDANNLTPGDTNGSRDVFVKDIQTGATTRVSTDSSNAAGNALSFGPSISTDGRYVTFHSDASNLVADDTNGIRDVFVKDTVTGITTRVSTDTPGAQSNGKSDLANLNTDGRFIVFRSSATNLAPDDNNLLDDVFLKDTLTGIVSLVSAPFSGPPVRHSANGLSFRSSINADGQYVAFESEANNLVVGDNNAKHDIFVSNSQTGSVTRVSTSSLGMESNDDSEFPSISGNGRYIAFASRANNLVENDTNGLSDVFIKDMQTGVTTRVSTVSSGAELSNSSPDSGINANGPSISADGRYVAFSNGGSIFVKDTQTGSLVPANTDFSGAPINGAYVIFSGPSLSPDGRYVAFFGYSLLDDTSDIYLKNLDNGVLTQINTNEFGVPAKPYYYPTISVSNNGLFVAFDFSGDTTGLVPGSNRNDGVFVKNISTGAIIRVNADATGIEANGSSGGPSISANGRYVTFSSDATNLVPGDTSENSEVFVKDVLTGMVLRVSTVPAGGQSNSGSGGGIISSDGRYVTFGSGATNLYAGDLNSRGDIFLVSVPIDTDEVDNRIEDAAPNAGDGNHDGILDSLQNQVTSLPNSVDQSYITLASPTGTSLAAVAPIANPSPSDSPPFVEFPFGHLNFAIDNTGVGSASTVTLYLPDNTVVNTYYKYGPTPDNNSPHWYEFLFDGSTGAEIFAGTDTDSDPEIIILHFIDGGRGDDDLTANGIVHDPGSPAFLPNQPPNPSAGGPYVVAEGSNLQLDASASIDPEDGTTLIYEWDLDYDGFVFNVDANGVRPNVSFSDNFPSRIIGLRVTDTQGLSSYAATSLEVTNVAPSPTIVSIGTLRLEGTSIAVIGSATDPAGVNDTLTYAWAVYKDGNTTAFATGGNSTSFSFTPNNNGSYQFVLTVSDEDGGSKSVNSTITVANVAPTVSPINAQVEPAAVTTLINASANFTDPGVADTHTAVWNWGDGSTSIGAVKETSGSGSVTGNHAYLTSGVYSVTLTIADHDSGSGQSVFQYIVIYDPAAGFVTGGGWINSPTGAYAANPALTGKANFGFESKYQNGNSVPTGSTEFQFKVANFNFKSTAYEWLVVSGAKARYRGTGTVNGAGSYGFELTAWDGQVNGGGGVDKFRIKIWNKNQGNGVVYDNMMGAADGADPTTALGGGSIVIHKSGSNLALNASVNGTPSSKARLTDSQLSTALSNAIAEWETQGLTSTQLRDLQGLTVSIADLPGNTLGMASESTNYVWVDADAAGYGWSFSTEDLRSGGVDLLSVLTHELGHKLGYDHDAMGESLNVGERHLAMQTNRVIPYYAELGKLVTNGLGILDAPLRLFSNGRGYSNLDGDLVRQTPRATLASVDQAMDDWADTAVWFSTDDEIEGQAMHGTLKYPVDESLDEDLLAELAMAFSK